MSGVVRTDMVSVTVHGPGGALDLVVPVGASVGDVTREYGTAARLRHLQLVLLDRAGHPLPAAQTVEAAGITAGSVLVVTPTSPPAGEAPVRRPSAERVDDPGPGVAWLVAGTAGVLALLGAVVAALGPEGNGRTATAIVLGVAAVAGVLPFGAHVRQRAAVAPAFAAGAAFVALHEPDATQAPVTVGLSLLVAGVAAALARASGVATQEPLDVWIVGGLAWFGSAAVVTVAGADPQVHWSIVLVGCLLASRLVPSLAVRVPEAMLVDLGRLSANAWSAGGPHVTDDQPIVEARVARMLAHGGRLVDAASVALAVSVMIAVPALVETATLGVDVWGASVLMLATGAGLLLASRDLRHQVARIALRLGALSAVAGGVGPHVAGLPAAMLPWLLVSSVLVAGLLVVAGIASGRGWRSVGWSRRAELAELLAGVIAIGAFVVASGWFRMVWEFRA